jgi:predicted nuclease of restriction endonuclease-like (RecB) superfamily
MADTSKELAVSNAAAVDENTLFECVAAIIDNRKATAASHVNREVTLMYWEVGRYISSVLLDGERGKYGKQIFSTLSRKLISTYGKTFDTENLYRMTRFARLFSDYETVSELSTSLSWSHFCELIRIKGNEARLYYANDAAQRRFGIRELRRQISRKSFERQEIANTQLSPESLVPFNLFKDPYILDTLGLKENFPEADLEKAILTEIESFLLEFGHGFSFVERQKRMTMDGDDFTLDLLFFHRILHRLVAIELKIGRFKPQYKGQMEFYLKWLSRYERQEGENEPIGIILCTTASRNQVELLELDKAGIAVAEYWTNLPSKPLFEEKIRSILSEAQERLERRKLLLKSGETQQIEYFLESDKDEGDEE